jgi:predicted SnoaL-like aldol condensation-catalyzing enzyme
MNRRTLIGNLALSTGLFAMSNQQSLAADLGADRKRQVVDMLKSIQTGDPGPISVVNPDKYIQHNLGAADGLAGFGALLQALPKGSARVNTVRVFQDGDYVFTHTDYNFFGPKIGFDIFRFENGKIVEHWDNLQETAGPNPSGHTMIDGQTEVKDLDKTQANKAVAKGFVEEVLGQRRMDRVTAWIDPVTYIQHNPHVGDGVEAMIAAFRKLDASGAPHRYHRTHKLLGEGDFVLAASEGVAGDTPTAFYDLFRVANGRIVEHWDVLETIPPRTDWKNGNCKF